MKLTTKFSFILFVLSLVVSTSKAFTIIRGSNTLLSLQQEKSLVLLFATLEEKEEGEEIEVIAAAAAAAAAGPKAAGRRVRRPSRSSNSLSNDVTDDDDTAVVASGPKQARGGQRRRQQQQQQRQRPENSSSSTSAPSLFDGKALTAAQNPHEEDALPLDLKAAIQNYNNNDNNNDKTDNGINIRCMTTPNIQFGNEIIAQPAFTCMSLDDLFGSELNFSKIFNSNSTFRNNLRNAIRQDIFNTTPFYANLSEKAASILLLPDSSLEGSWRIMIPSENENEEKNEEEKDSKQSMDQIRMKQTTIVLKEGLGSMAPTGDELFQTIGSLCGPKPTTHWIDIFGVQDRKISHSWHLDSGMSPENSKTVLWGFPREDDYIGCGVFSHLVPLKNTCIAPDDHHSRLEPILFDGIIDDSYIVRPIYKPGKELIMYRDIDVLHSAPDVTYRTSIMRFM